MCECRHTGTDLQCVSAATLGWKQQIKITFSPTYSTPTPNQPVLLLILQRRAGKPLEYHLEVLHWGKWGLIPLSSALDPLTFTTGPLCVTECVCLLAGCLTSQQHASVCQGRVCTDNFTCCHTEIEAADQTFYLTQSQCTDTGPTCPSTYPITPGAWQGSHWSANFSVTGMTRPGKIPSQARFEPRIFRSRGGRLNH